MNSFSQIAWYLSPLISAIQRYRYTETHITDNKTKNINKKVKGRVYREMLQTTHLSWPRPAP